MVTGMEWRSRWGHAWTFVGAQGGSGQPGYDVPVAIAICVQCGEARSARALVQPPFDHIDLDGTCPMAANPNAKRR